MKAGELTLQGTLTAQQQYVIPIFQRYYAWDTKQWDELWEDIKELSEKPGSRHFMGALVFVPQNTPVTYSFPVYQVIDGQQRIITFSLLLTALRNMCATAGHQQLADEITNSVLVHQYKADQEHFRVYPRQRDRQDFIDAIIGKGKPTNRVGKALNFFTDAIPEIVPDPTPEALRAFYNLLLRGLEFVHINLDAENPYKIFRSLNSTGEDLSPADLIRNFVFMSIPIGRQDQFDKDLWTPLELRFTNGKNEVNAKLVSSFFRDFLMVTGEHIAPADTFEVFEGRYKNADAFRLVAELTSAAKLYDYIRGAVAQPNPKMNLVLMKLRQLDSSTAFPLILRLFGMLEAQRISTDQFIECVESISGFIFRRYVCGENSRAYAKWFVAACNAVNSTDPGGSLERFLTERGSFPPDARFVSALVKFPLYSSKYAFSVLQELETSFGNKEAPDPERATVEHIMPQTLSKEWKEDLGPDARRIHEDWLDTLGNLTFTGYNTGLSNKRFSIKLEGFGDTVGYRKSNFELTKMFLPGTKWGEEEIAKRGQELAERAAGIWVGPRFTPSSVSDAARPENPFSATGTRSKLFNILLDGQWHSIATIQEQYGWDVSHRVERLRKIGARTGKWSIDQEGDKIRMSWPVN